VSSTVRPKNSGGLSVVATAEVVNTANNGLPFIRESAKPPEAILGEEQVEDVRPDNKYFGLRTVRYRSQSGNDSGQYSAKPRQSFLDILRAKLGGDRRCLRSYEKSFEKICFELACADHSEAGSEDTALMFELEDLHIQISLLAKSFRIVLPPYVEVAGLGELEEQGIGGTCDQFIGSLPESCRKVSEKASPLGLVPKLLPHGLISKAARYVGSCFWIWLCIVDGRPHLSDIFQQDTNIHLDLTENLLGKEWEDTGSFLC